MAILLTTLGRSPARRHSSDAGTPDHYFCTATEQAPDCPAPKRIARDRMVFVPALRRRIAVTG